MEWCSGGANMARGHALSSVRRAHAPPKKFRTAAASRRCVSSPLTVAMAAFTLQERPHTKVQVLSPEATGSHTTRQPR